VTEPSGTAIGPVLAGRVAAVTGGAGGIGGGVTRRLAAAGATVVVNDIDDALLDAITLELAPRVVPVVGDVRDPATLDRLLDAARDVAGGRVDVLVNNVGDFRPATRDFLSSDEAQWQAQYAINLEHVIRSCHRFGAVMVAQGSGSVINVSTVETLRGIPGHAVYSGFNAGINAFSRSLAVEWGNHGVRVNVIAPDLADSLQTPAAAMLRGRDPALIPHWTPLGHFGAPEEFGDVVLFLASDLSRYVTGTVIPVDGGTSAAGGWYRRADGKRWTNTPDVP
jgi:NAD(P)-dependent dehydrogenase (short-subunit alcohol dehydrogenase family)